MGPHLGLLWPPKVPLGPPGAPRGGYLTCGLLAPGPDILLGGISELRVWRMSQAKRAGPPLARHLRAQSLEDVSSETGRTTSCAAPEAQRFGDVSGETAWTTSRAASQSPELRGCLRRSGPEHLSRGISEPRVARMSQAKRAGPPLARHLGAQSCEDFSGETGQTTSRAASRSPESRGCLRRNGQDHLSRGISEPRVSGMSQAKRAGPRLARHLRAQSFEDVSGETGRTTSRAASQSPEFGGCLRRNAQSRTTQKREL